MPVSDSLDGRDWGTSLSLRDLLTVFFKRWKMIVGVVMAAVAVAAVVILVRPEQYEAKATLLVSGARAELAFAPTEATQFVTQLSEQDLNSEVYVLKSRKLIEEVIDALGEGAAGKDNDHDEVVNAVSPRGGTSRLQAALSPEETQSFDQMVVALSDQIQINLVRKSNVIEVSYRSTDPDWATRVVKTFTERYIEHRAERGRAREAVTFFEGQMLAAERKLKESETTLEAYLDANQFTLTKGPLGSDSLASQKELVIDRLALLQDQLGEAEADLQELTRKIDSLRGRLGEEPERLSSSDPMNRDAATDTIKRHLIELELERDRLLQDFKPESRYVQDIDSQIELARERLTKLTAQLGAADGTEVNPIHQNLREELLRSEAELAGTTARYDTLRRQVADHTAELERLNARAFDLERLHRQAQAAEEEYLLYRKKHEEARISAAMDQQKLINVTIAQPAQRPLTPIGKDNRTVVVLALLLGVLGGLGAAFGTEFYLDRSFTTGEEMERKIGLVHLASIPEEL